MSRFTFAIGAVAIALAASACGGGDDEYPQAAEDNFMASCRAQPGASEATCRCVFDELEERLSYEDFQKAETAIVNGRPAPEEVQEQVLEAISECRS